jgi:alanine racemase
VPGVAPGTDVTLIGREDDQQITANDLALWMGTISYEILCRLGRRVQRVYKDA